MKNILYTLVAIATTLQASEASNIFESEEVKAIQREFTEFSLRTPGEQQSVQWTRESFPITCYADLPEDRQAQLIELKAKRDNLIERLFPAIRTRQEYRNRKTALSAYNTDNVIDARYNEGTDHVLEVKTSCLAAETIHVHNYAAERRLPQIAHIRQTRLKRLQSTPHTK